MPTCDAYKTIASLNQILASRKFGVDSEENFVVLADAVQHLKIGLDVNGHLNSCLDDSEAEIRRLHSELATMERCREEKYSMACQERDALAARVAQLEQEKTVLIDFAKKSCEACEICRHVDIMASEKCEGICDECALASCCVCAKCYGSSEFEFAGVGEGNGL